MIITVIVSVNVNHISIMPVILTIIKTASYDQVSNFRVNQLPATIKVQISELIYCHYHSPGVRSHLSIRWIGQKRLTNSQGTNHESWMVRCSPRAPGFSREQSAWQCLWASSKIYFLSLFMSCSYFLCLTH